MRDFLIKLLGGFTTQEVSFLVAKAMGARIVETLASIPEPKKKGNPCLN